SALMRKRALQFMIGTDCPACRGKRLRREALTVTFAGRDIADLSALPMARLAGILKPYAEGAAPGLAKLNEEHPEKALVVKRIACDLVARLAVLLDLGLAAGQHGGEILDRGPPAGLAGVEASQTRRHLFREQAAPARTPRAPRGWLRLAGVSRNNLRGLDVDFPLGVFTSVTGISGS